MRQAWRAAWASRIEIHSGVDRLAAAVLKQAAVDRDDGFFADGATVRFWCAAAGLPVLLVQASYRRLAAGSDDAGEPTGDEGGGSVPTEPPTCPWWGDEGGLTLDYFWRP
jgi:hypothetical protein